MRIDIVNNPHSIFIPHVLHDIVSYKILPLYSLEDTLIFSVVIIQNNMGGAFRESIFTNPIT